MKIVAAILFLLPLILTQTPLGQLLKLPVLVQHYNKHKKQEGLSLLEFVNEHYATDHDDADRSEDEQLPFKSEMMQSMGVAIVPLIPLTDFSLEFIVPTKVLLNDSYTPQQHLCSIFHPPRV